MKTDKPMLLAVDDAPENLALLHGLLRDDYQLKVADNGTKALEIARQQPAPALILLDVMMPLVDGYEVCRQLKDDPRTREIPVLFLTAQHDADNETAGFAAGAVDFVHKPISGPVLLARIRNQLALKAATDALRNQNDCLEREVVKRTREVLAIQDGIIVSLAAVVETRDNDTGNHIRRTQRYVQALGTQLRDHPRFHDQLSEHVINLMFKTAPLHDIGKIGIPDSILLKPGKLTPAEFDIMKTHTSLGYDALVRAEQEIGLPQEFIVVAKEIARSHHEKWDGSGYPQGLAGDAIPLSARLMAVADVYDALISRRAYKPPFTHEAAVDIIARGRGSHFDPDIADAFLAIADQFSKIAEQYHDGDDESVSNLRQAHLETSEQGNAN